MRVVEAHAGRPGRPGPGVVGPPSPAEVTIDRPRRAIEAWTEGGRGPAPSTPALRRTSGGAGRLRGPAPHARRCGSGASRPWSGGGASRFVAAGPRHPSQMDYGSLPSTEKVILRIGLAPRWIQAVTVFPSGERPRYAIGRDDRDPDVGHGIHIHLAEGPATRCLPHHERRRSPLARPVGVRFAPPVVRVEPQDRPDEVSPVRGDGEAIDRPRGQIGGWIGRPDTGPRPRAGPTSSTPSRRRATPPRAPAVGGAKHHRRALPRRGPRAVGRRPAGVVRKHWTASLPTAIRHPFAIGTTGDVGGIGARSARGAPGGTVSAQADRFKPNHPFRAAAASVAPTGGSAPQRLDKQVQRSRRLVRRGRPRSPGRSTDRRLPGGGVAGLLRIIPGSDRLPRAFFASSRPVPPPCRAASARFPLSFLSSSRADTASRHCKIHRPARPASNARRIPARRLAGRGCGGTTPRAASVSLMRRVRTGRSSTTALPGPSASAGVW